MDQVNHFMSSVIKRIALNQAVLTLALVTVPFSRVAPAATPAPPPAATPAPIVSADSS